MANNAQPRILRFVERDPNDLIFRAIRRLTIRSAQLRRRRLPQTMGAPNWITLVQYIKRLTRLETLIFGCAESVPLALLTVLEEFHPTSHLHLRNWVRKSRDVKVGDPEEETLARSPLPSQIVALAPNITSASFKRDIDYEEETRECAKLEVECVGPKKVLENLGWPFIRPTSISQLEKSFELRSLKSLDTGLFYYVCFRVAIEQGTFQGLRHLTFRIPITEDGQIDEKEKRSTIMKFLCSLTAPQSISITDYTKFIDIPVLLQRYGPSLRSLTLHETEQPVFNRPVLSPDQLNDIRVNTPNLEFLSIDIDRAMDTTEIYATLPKFSTLLHLVLHCDLGLHRHSLHASIDSRFVEAVWGNVTVGKPGKLDKLTLCIGEQERDVAATLGPQWIHEEIRGRRKFDVTRSERDDQPDMIFVYKHRDFNDECRKAKEEFEAQLQSYLELLRTHASYTLSNP
ncbi:hypothetical protein PQX77_013140 [Marasmius sp. AFHP31]|nr:hypothetical protein PQX77_013140 [Marasmius sp. AFHP31]